MLPEGIIYPVVSCRSLFCSHVTRGYHPPSSQCRSLIWGENSLVVLHLLGKKQETCFWWYHTQIGFEQSQQTQFDIFHTKMLQNTSRCHVTASIWILCNILENIPHALDVHAQRVLKYNFILIYDFTIIETGRFKVFL